MSKHIIIMSMLLFACTVFAAREIKYPNDASPHWIYLPNKIDPDKTYWVVVGVHGADWRNRGGCGISGWADKKSNVIVIAPKFSKVYQNATPEDQEILIGLFKQVQKEYKVHPKVFIYGFSGGSQFGHRFAMKRPEYVCGVSSHSGGSWGTDAYGKINLKAKHIPFAISCGEKDTGKAWNAAPYGRLDWYKRFRDIIAEKGFFYKGATWPNVGHRDSPGVWKMTEECWQLATTGMLKSSTVGAKLKEAKKLAEEGEFAKAEKIKAELGRSESLKLPEESGWHDSKEALAIRRKSVALAVAEIDTSRETKQKFTLYKRCLALVRSENKPQDNMMLGFMQKCPPSFWINKEGGKEILAVCNSAAEKYIAALREQNKLTFTFRRKYIEQWDGLQAQKTLLAEYNEASNKQLEQVLAIPSKYKRASSLRSFVRKWQSGEAVDKANAELAKLK
ncbi:hypothetical protein BVX94_01185 [bacterium B17]|nr:hypothetical protein BVX94_01185 [bacterium B17]